MYIILSSLSPSCHLISVLLQDKIGKSIRSSLFQFPLSPVNLIDEADIAGRDTMYSARDEMTLLTWRWFLGKRELIAQEIAQSVCLPVLSVCPLTFGEFIQASRRDQVLGLLTVNIPEKKEFHFQKCFFDIDGQDSSEYISVVF